MGVDEAARVFDGHRRYLLGVAYRLTGSWADAEDAVADAWPRWAANAADVREPRGWLTTVVARIALDQLRSARMRRETYVGPWLPEPLVAAAAPTGATGSARDALGTDPVEVVMWDESVRMAFLVVLDQLSPEQRLAVVLHDAAGLDFVAVAEVIGCTPAAARQHASRGRRRLDDAGMPPRAPVGVAWELLDELASALTSGDDQRLATLLAPDVVLVGDGGGQVTAARRPIVGRAAVAQFLAGVAARFAPHATFELASVNGEPGFVARLDTGRPQDATVAVYAFAIRDGKIANLYGILAPEKVSRVPSSAALTGSVAD